ncbi:MAG: hypothetical protein DCC46_01710 [Armatimonadetes bacterium]|nr:MAG: hypothetical protein DCC46_01710 [Armatimonadota bacterium]
MGEALVPKLRFPEFSGEWRTVTVADFFASAENHEKATSFESDKILTVKLHGNGVVRNERTGTLTGGTNYVKRRAGQFIFSKIDLLNGAFGIVPEELDGFYSSTDVPAFSFGPDRSPEFFLSWLRENYKRLGIERTGTSATLKRVAPDTFRAVSLLAPSPAEQRKIAECLTSLDELIAAEGRKLEALRAFKKGLMQNLFPREGETTPRLRFPEFRTSGEWEETSIARTADVITGSTPSTARREYYGGAYQFVSPADITEERYVEQTKTTLSEEGFAVTRFVPAGSVLFVCIGSTIGKVAQNKEHCATNQQINAVVPGPDSFGDFLYYGLAQLSGAVAALAGRQAVPIVSKSLFSSIKIRCPGLPEQRRIASCLGSLDTLITEQSKKLATLKTHKQGLMQGLFPSPESKDACPEMEPL